MQVVAGDELRGFLLIGRSRHGNGAAVHDVEHFRLRVGEDQVFQLDHAEQVAPLVGDAARVDGLLAAGLLTDTHERRFGGHVRLEVDVLGRHDAAGAVLWIAQQRVGQLALLGRQLLQQALDRGRRQLVEQLRAVVVGHFLDHFLDFVVRGVLQKAFLLFDVQQLEHLDGQILGQQSEIKHQAGRRQIALQPFGDVDRLHVGEQLLGFAEALLVDAVLDLFKKFVAFQKKHSFRIPAAAARRRERDVRAGRKPPELLCRIVREYRQRVDPSVSDRLLLMKTP